MPPEAGGFLSERTGADTGISVVPGVPPEECALRMAEGIMPRPAGFAVTGVVGGTAYSVPHARLDSALFRVPSCTKVTVFLSDGDGVKVIRDAALESYDGATLQLTPPSGQQRTVKRADLFAVVIAAPPSLPVGSVQPTSASRDPSVAQVTAELKAEATRKADAEAGMKGILRAALVECASSVGLRPEKPSETGILDFVADSMKALGRDAGCLAEDSASSGIPSMRFSQTDEAAWVAQFGKISYERLSQSRGATYAWMRLYITNVVEDRMSDKKSKKAALRAKVEKLLNGVTGPTPDTEPAIRMSFVEAAEQWGIKFVPATAELVVPDDASAPMLYHVRAVLFGSEIMAAVMASEAKKDFKKHAPPMRTFKEAVPPKAIGGVELRWQVEASPALS